MKTSRILLLLMLLTKCTKPGSRLYWEQQLIPSTIKTMLNKRIDLLLVILCCTLFSCSGLQPSGDKAERGRFLLLDSRLISDTENVKLVVGTVEKHPENPLFGEDNPWEVRFDNLYGNVIFDYEDDLYKCWYSPFIVDYSSRNMPLEQRQFVEYTEHPNREMGICYATSMDGITWDKPSLGLVDYDGDKQNNIVWRGPHGTGIFKDYYETEPLRRYKAIFLGMEVSFSEDGLHWSETLHCNGVDVAGDTHNNAFWAPTLNKYVGITRMWGDMGREVARIESEDFINWTKEKVVIKAEDENLQPYAMPVFYYGGVYLGLLAIHNQEADRVHTELAWSPDTKEWNRISANTPLIPCSTIELDYDYGCVYACATPVILKNEIRLYYGGSDWLHTSWRNGSLCLATLRPDGFAGYIQQMDNKPAIITTTPVSYNQQAIKITADISQGGSLKVVVLDNNGNHITDTKPILNSVTDGILSLEKKVDADMIRLKFEFSDAKLYSFSFGELVE